MRLAQYQFRFIDPVRCVLWSTIARTMFDSVSENLVLDLLEWLGKQDRTYEETMEAWRTSCPKLPVWEDATDRGLISMDFAQGRNIVRITDAGLALLRQRRLPKV